MADSNIANSNAADGRSSRRRLLTAIIGAGSGLIGAIFAIPSAAYVISPALRPSTKRMVQVGELADIPENETTAVRYQTLVQDGWLTVNARRIVYVRHASPPRAWSATCTHLGCNVSWDDAARQFKCPCHAGVFDENGEVVSGPPPRPLKELTVEVREGEIYVEEERV